MTVIEINSLTKEYPLSSGFLASLRGRKEVVHAVRGIDLSIEKGELLGLVGESGCGKTTTGKVLARLEMPTTGEISMNGEDISSLHGEPLRRFRHHVQMISQDPYDSLNARHQVIEIVAQPLRYLGIGSSAAERRDRALQALQQVEMIPPEFYAQRYPHQLSGGQRQRVAIARALVVQPEFVVADEPVSMLDVSVRAGVLNLLQKLNTEFGISMLFITHDLASARYLCQRIAVMYLGKIVEISPTEELVASPKHPYSRLLLSAAPDLFRPGDRKLALHGEAVNAVSPQIGCQFAPRCPYAQDRCVREEPHLRFLNPNHAVSCHFAEQIDRQEEGVQGS